MHIIHDFKQKFATDGYFKFRTISVLLAVFFSFCAFWLGMSLFSTMFGSGFFLAGLGRFFLRSFGILSLFIPFYFGFAAFILADTKWRPDRIFFLTSLIIPFLTLSIGLAFARSAGPSMLVIFITVIEVLALHMIKNAVFFNSGLFSRRAALLLPPMETNAAETASADNVSQVVSNDKQTILQSDELNYLPRREIEKPVVSFIDTYENDSTNNDVDELTSLEANDAEEIDNEEIGNIEETDEIDDVIDEETDESDELTETDTVLRALEEAEAAAAVHGEQVRKKNTQVGSSRYKKYRIPVDILNEYPDGEYWVIDQATRDAAIALKETLEEFKIQAEVTGIRKGPVITMFEILPAPGVKLSKIVGLQDNIALRLAASSVRIVAPIPGKHAVGIEVPNAKRNIVSFKEIIEGELRKDDKMGIPVVMGKDISGEAQTVDLVQMPHLLIAGATGSGKSVCVNAIILSILYQLHPNECRLMLIDPKIVELKLYNDIPHLLTPVITESKKAFQALQYCIYEMERRYACLDNMGVRDIRSYNKRIKEKNIAQEHMPYIVVIIDEFADLMSTTGKELESTVARLAAMSRAVGIHLVLATQRPSIDVITGLIKANIPSRIAFMVASKTDSRIIIDMVGAEKLLGKGDMLYSGVVDPFPIRMQGAFISEEEVEAVVEHVKTFGEPEYIDDEIFFEEEDDEMGASLFSEGGDPLYEKALEIVMQQGKASASFIQRRLKIGFNRAARIVDEMEHYGVVGPASGSKPRELLRGSGIGA